MAKAASGFIADDGTLFDTLEDAEAHDQDLRLKVKLGQYAAAAQMSKAAVTHLEKHLTAFRLFAEHGVMPVVPEKKPGRPKKVKTAA